MKLEEAPLAAMGTGHGMGQLDVKQEGTTRPTPACEEAAVSNQAFPILSIT